MKIQKFKELLFFIMLCMTVGSVSFAQQPWNDSRYGSDSASRMQCAQNLSILNQFMKVDVIDYAIDAWKDVFKDCPRSSKNIYIYGVRIYKYLIEKATDSVQIRQRIDTLMLIYSRRIELYGEEGLVSGREGLDLLKYPTYLNKAYTLLSKSVDTQKEKSEEIILVGLMQASSTLYKDRKIDQGQYLTDFAKIASILDEKLETNNQDERTVKAMETVQLILQNGGLISCKSLEEYFAREFERNKLNSDWLKRALLVMDNNKCTDTIYAQCMVQLYTIEPSVDLARSIARYYIGKEDYNHAVVFYKNTTLFEKDSTKKAKDFYQLAALVGGKLEQFKAARDYALEAARYQPRWGDPYIFIGNLYAVSSKTCGSNEFEQKAVYWVAVDMFNRAIAIDPTVTEEAKRLIAQYSQYFPNKETSFFNGFTEGQTYTVGCWINESTRVRF